MAVKTEQLALLDFYDWCRRNIDSDKLTALMTDFGYDRSDSETIAQAIQNPDFYDAFGDLLRTSLNEEKSYAEQMRAKGELTANDWLQLSKAGTFAKATGTTTTTTPSTLAIIGGLLSGVGTALGGLFGNTTTVTPAPATTTTTGSSTFLWIILAVVILAVVVILAMSTAKKK